MARVTWSGSPTTATIQGYKASNPVVSDDGRLIAFQLAKSNEAAGVGHCIFIYDIANAEKEQLSHSK